MLGGGTEDVRLWESGDCEGGCVVDVCVGSDDAVERSVRNTSRYMSFVV
jgi:hypothetical protein